MCFQTMETYLEDYNTENKVAMHLVMFRFAIEHISRISRLLMQPNGHGLLVGECSTPTSLRLYLMISKQRLYFHHYIF